MKVFFAILGTLITGAIGYYQYFYDHETECPKNLLELLY